MSYFEGFPSQLFTLRRDDGTEMTTRLVDITRNVRFRETLATVSQTMYPYDLKDGESLEVLCERIYGTPDYAWAVMLLNNRLDPMADYPLTYAQLQAYVTEKYGEGNEDDLYAYVDDDGFYVTPDAPGATPVTNAQYELQENEDKRTIQLVSPEVMSYIASQLAGLIQER